MLLPPLYILFVECIHFVIVPIILIVILTRIAGKPNVFSFLKFSRVLIIFSESNNQFNPQTDLRLHLASSNWAQVTSIAQTNAY